jgi:DNA helicase HerA-like ATPase
MTNTEHSILIGKSVGKRAALQTLDLRYANRHGLVAGATGTGKTVTLQSLAEGFSAAGVPVFLADVKGDLSGMSQPGGGPKLVERAAKTGVADYAPEGFPTIYWDVFGEQGHPVRATVSEMGPLLLARMLGLSEVQEGVLNVVFRVADDGGLLLLDLKDLRAMLGHVGDQAAELKTRYGNVSATSIGAIQRQLLVLENQGAERFFGEPALDLSDLMRTGRGGRGAINVLAADKLIQSPRLYATFLLWLLSELFETLPEVGDRGKPKLVFFFDEAHLLFEDAPKILLDKIEQVVRLIRSKGVGVYFVTQSPTDIPDDVLGQLGNRVQHALRAFTPKDQKAVRAAAETFVANPQLDAAAAVTQLAVGEALVSTLGEGGVPGMVQRTLIRPPASRLGPATADERAAAATASPVAGVYDQPVDRDSAYERLTVRATAPATDVWGRRGSVPSSGRPAEPPRANPPPVERAPEPRETAPRDTGRGGGSIFDTLGGSSGPGRRRESLGQAMAKSVVRSVGSAIGREIVRGVLGSILKGR